MSDLLSQKLKNDKILLAERLLDTASTALDNLDALNAEGALGAKDLIAVFNSAVKAHRELVSDVRNMDDVESPAEAKLAQSKEYSLTVDRLLDSLKKDG